MNWRYTNIQHGPRLELGITPNEYCVLDVYYQTQASPIYSVDGWSENTYKQVADFLGFSKGAVFKMVDRFVKEGLMDVNPANPKQKRTTEKWYLNAYERVSKVNAKVSKVNVARSLSERKSFQSERHTEEREVKENIKTNKRDCVSFPKEVSPERADSIPTSDYTTASMNDFLAGGEKTYQNIHNRVKAYFTKEEQAKPFTESANCKMDGKQFNTELEAWIRYNMGREDFFSNPTKFLRGGKGNFYSWIQQPFKSYHKNSPLRADQPQPQPLKRVSDLNLYC